MDSKHIKWGVGENLGSELLADPGFDNAGSWLCYSGFAITAGTANVSSGTYPWFQTFVVVVTAGHTYRTEYTVTNHTGSSYIQIAIGETNGTLHNESGGGTYIQNLTATNNGRFVINCGETATYTIDNVSLKEIL